MRELTVRLRFTKHCLGNTKAKDDSGRFLMPRNPSGQVIFLATWHRANMLFASQVLGRHQDEVQKILWDITVDGNVPRNRYRRYPGNGNKFVEHECFYPGQTVGINCVVPDTISDDDFRQLMQLAGTYRGLSPFHPTKNGFFEVVSMNLRRRKPVEENNAGKEEQTDMKQNEVKPVPMA